MGTGAFNLSADMAGLPGEKRCGEYAQSGSCLWEI